MSHQVDINRATACIAQGCAFAKRISPWAVIRSNMHPTVKVQECGSAPSPALAVALLLLISRGPVHTHKRRTEDFYAATLCTQRSRSHYMERYIRCR
jgi:hypothetical protein